MISESTVAEPRSSRVGFAARAAASTTAPSSAAMTATDAALAGHAEPDRRLREIADEGLQEGRERGLQRQAVRAGGSTDRNGIGAGPGSASRTGCGQPLFAAAMKAAPCSVVSAWRSREPASAAPSTASSPRSPPVSRPPPGFSEEHRIVPAGADADERAQASPSQGRRIAHQRRPSTADSSP